MCALIVTNIRRVEKRTLTPLLVPTVAPSNDHTDGTWTANDIYPGEIFMNLADRKAYTSDGSIIFEIGSTGSADLADVLSIDPATDGNDIDISTGDVIRIHDGARNTEISTLPLTSNNAIDFPNKSGTVALLDDVGAVPTLQQVLAAGSSTGPSAVILQFKPINRIQNDVIHSVIGPLVLDMLSYSRMNLILYDDVNTLSHGVLSGQQDWYIQIKVISNCTITWEPTGGQWSHAEGVVLPTTVLAGEEYVLDVITAHGRAHILKVNKVVNVT